MAVFRVVIEVDEPTLEDAEEHILSLSGSDLVDEIVEVEEEKMCNCTNEGTFTVHYCHTKEEK